MTERYTHVINIDALAAHYTDPDWAIFDCRFELANPELGRTQYLEDHIPGARYVHLDHELSGPITGASGRHPLPDLDELEATFSSLGIDPSVQVVAYDASGGGYAARMWWCLQYAGHSAAAVLDGGYPAWVQAGMPTRSGQEDHSPRVFHAVQRSELRVDTTSLLENLGSRNLVLLDSRAGERYRGEVEPIDPVAGHIPGAVNRAWQSNLTDEGTWRDPESLRHEFEALLDGHPADQLVAYCGSGVTACHNLLSMAYAGFDGMRLYPGSWSEWIRDPARPVVTPKPGISGSEP